MASGQVLACRRGVNSLGCRLRCNIKTEDSLAPNQVAVVVILVVPGTPGAPVAVEVAGRVDFSLTDSLGVGSEESEKVDRAGTVCESSCSPSEESVNGVPV